MEPANVHSLDERRNAAAAIDPPASEFETVDPDDLIADDPDPVVPTDGEPTAEDLAAIEAEATGDTPGDEDTTPETPAEDLGPCTTCDGKGTHEMGGGEFETCDPCGGTGREGAQGSLFGSGDVHVDTGQVRAFDVDALTVKDGSRLGGRRATTGEVSIAGATAKALRLDARNRIPKGASVRLEVVGRLDKVGEYDKLKDGYHAGTVRTHAVRASNVEVVSWMHDEEGLRWDLEHGLRERVRDGVWRKVDEPAAPEADAEPDTDANPEGVPATDEPSTTEQDGPPTELPETPSEPAEGTENPSTVEDPADPENAALVDALEQSLTGDDPAAAGSAGTGLILGRPETYTPENLEPLKKDELREVLADLNVSGVPARIDRDTLLAMANSAAGNVAT